MIKWAFFPDNWVGRDHVSPWLATSYKNKVKLRLEKCREEKIAVSVWGGSYCLIRKSQNSIFSSWKELLHNGLTRVAWGEANGVVSFPHLSTKWWLPVFPNEGCLVPARPLLAVHLLPFHLVVNRIVVYFKENNLFVLVFSHVIFFLQMWVSRRSKSLLHK